MNTGRDSKSSSSSDNTMRAIFTESQSFALPDDKGFEHVERIRAALSSYYETRRPPMQEPSSSSGGSAATAASSGQTMTSMAAITGAMSSAIESPLTPLPGKKIKTIKPIRVLASHEDSELLEKKST